MCVIFCRVEHYGVYFRCVKREHIRDGTWPLLQSRSNAPPSHCSGRLLWPDNSSTDAHSRQTHPQCLAAPIKVGFV